MIAKDVDSSSAFCSGESVQCVASSSGVLPGKYFFVIKALAAAMINEEGTSVIKFAGSHWQLCLWQKILGEFKFSDA